MKIYTTGQIATICSVASRTVAMWIDTGKLKGYKLPGSQDRRVLESEFVKFLKENGMEFLIPKGEVRSPDLTLLDTFMKLAGVKFFESPTRPDDQTILRCAKIVREESEELIVELGYKDTGGTLIREFGTPNLRKVAKEAIDVIYVALYTLRAFGFQWKDIAEAWRLVAENNNAKFGEGSSRRPGDGKVIPPPGFVKEKLDSLDI